VGPPAWITIGENGLDLLLLDELLVSAKPDALRHRLLHGPPRDPALLPNPALEQINKKCQNQR
jgi:hypothetical protein